MQSVRSQSLCNVRAHLYHYNMEIPVEEVAGEEYNINGMTMGLYCVWFTYHCVNVY